MNLRCVSTLLVLIPFLEVSAATHRVEVLKEAPPKEVAKDIAAQLQPTGFKVVRGTSRTVCDVWLCKAWPVAGDFEATDEVLYPFKPGQLIGVIRYPRKASDFRDQEIESGIYTMRYAQQPVDGSHIGTSPTRDFVLLISAEEDSKPTDLENDPLIEKSTEAAGTTHPAMLCMQRVRGKVAADLTIRHNEEHDWWIVTVQGDAKSGDETKKLPVDFVFVGISSEV